MPDSRDGQRLMPEHVLSALRSQEPVAIANPFRATDPRPSLMRNGLHASGIADAEARLARFAPLIAELFPETQDSHGIIDSPIEELRCDVPVASGRTPGAVFAKLDNDLPISGSVKARGGIYAVMKHAEEVALSAGLISVGGDYRALNTGEARSAFSRHTVSVGSTGNLALSIGIMSQRLGFSATVHMSRDAKAWKKELLRSHGVRVVEHDTDYVHAVAAGRAEAAQSEFTHFIDDEHSEDLFYGYAVAAARVIRQLEHANVRISEQSPLTVYLPCGIGGAPGGIAFGLKCQLGSAVRCVFVEPTSAPSMLYGILSGRYEKAKVADLGLDGLTAADGLAVTSASSFVSRAMEPLIDGFVTVSDDEAFTSLALLDAWNGIDVEPSAATALAAWLRVSGGLATNDEAGAIGAPKSLAAADGPALAWLTGGSMMPADEMSANLRHGRALLGGR